MIKVAFGIILSPRIRRPLLLFILLVGLPALLCATDTQTTDRSGELTGTVQIKEAGETRPFEGNVMLEVLRGANETLMILPKPTDPEGRFAFDTIMPPPFSYRVHAIYQSGHFVSPIVQLPPNSDRIKVELTVGDEAPAEMRLAMPNPAVAAPLSGSTRTESPWRRPRLISIGLAGLVLLLAFILWSRSRLSPSGEAEKWRILAAWSELEDHYAEKRMDAANYRERQSEFVRALDALYKG